MTRSFFIPLTVIAALALAACEAPERRPHKPQQQHSSRFGYKPGDETTEVIQQDNAGPTRRDTTDMNQGPSSAPPPPPSNREDRASAPVPPPAPKKDYPYATPVPGKSGFVTSPFAPYSGYVDVRGFPPGTEVKDPYTQKIFLVP